MVCEHLKALEDELTQTGMQPDFSGAAWSKDCRNWTYYPCCFDLESLQSRFNFSKSVEVWTHVGTHDGSEQGLVCRECHDAIMGYHPSVRSEPIYR